MPARRRIRIVAIVAGLLPAFVAGQPSLAAEPAGHTRVVSHGSAPGTTPAARDDAIDMAKAQAVSMWLEVLLGETPDVRFERITANDDKYVESVRLADLALVEGNTHVEVEAYLNEWALRIDTASILFQSRTAPPRVAFLIDEEVVQENARRFQQECAVAAPLEEAFRKQGFALVSAEAVDAAYSNRDIAMLIGSPNSDLRRIGREFGADAVVVVRSIVEVGPAESSRNMLNAHAEIDARVVGVRDGEVYEEVRSAAEVVCAIGEDGVRFAVDDAVYKLRDRVIVGAALAAGIGASSNAHTLTLTGVSSWLEVERTSEYLARYPGVSEVSVVSARQDRGQIRFEYSGRMAALVTYLEQGAEGFPGLRVESVVGTELRFAMPD